MSLNDRFNAAAFFAGKDDDIMGYQPKPIPLHSEGKVVNLKFALFPHRCVLSGRRLWLEKAYRVVEQYTGYDDDDMRFRQVTYVHWIDKKEYIMWKLKQ